MRLISDRRFEVELQAQAGYLPAIMRTESLPATLALEIRRVNLKRLGFQAEHLTHSQHLTLQEQLGQKVLKPTEGWLTEQRSIKGPEELTLIRKAIAIQEQAFTQTLREIRAGMTENQIACRLEYHMRDRGASGPSFPSIIAAGHHAARPHHRPTHRRIRRGEPILVDFGARYGGYCGDLTRMICLGRVPARWKEIHRLVQEAVEAGIQAIRPERPACEVDQAARSVIEKAGYGEAFNHSLGHGIGLEVHEWPSLHRRNPKPLQTGQIVTVEPGIYLEWGGVRLEEDVWIGPKGPQRLSSLPLDL